MNGFKPTGFGPKAGFHFSPKMGFTGSTGSVTHVSPYVRRKGFASGGFVREDSPRMTTENVGDTGSALVRRARPFSEQEREAGGRSPLRPGFKNGGRLAKTLKKMHKAGGGKVMQPKGMGPMSSMEMGTMLRKAMPKKPGMPATGMKGKFAADGGRVYGSSSKGFGSDLRKTGEFIGQIPRMLTDAARGSFRRTQQDVTDTKRRRIDSIVDHGNTASNYARGGKIMASRFAKGGMARPDEAQDRKMIGAALRKHVSTPAPKGHKGLGAMCK